MGREGGTRDVVHLPTRRQPTRRLVYLWWQGQGRGQHRIAAFLLPTSLKKRRGKGQAVASLLPPRCFSSSIPRSFTPISNPGPTDLQLQAAARGEEGDIYIHSQGGEALSSSGKEFRPARSLRRPGGGRMPSRAMNGLFLESSSSSGSGGCREAEPAAAVLCAPRPRRAQVHPCTADLILGPPPFLLNSNKSKEGGKTKSPEADGDEDGGWALFGGSPPARADNPLVHDPHFLLNQRHPVDSSPLELGIFDHQSRSNYSHHHRPTYISSSSSSNSFAPSFAPAVRIQGFDVAACRGSAHNNGSSRVLSARA